MRQGKTESVLETFARAIGASAGIAVHTGSDVAEEILSAARRIRERIAKGADRVKNVSAGKVSATRAARRPKAPTATARVKRAVKSAVKK